MKFAKLVSTGNDFIVIEKRKMTSHEIKRVCHSHFGIGADGLIMLEEDSIADVFMHIFNADGSEARMCGNGLKIVAHYMKYHRRISRQIFRVNTLSGMYEVGFKAGMIYAKMSRAIEIDKKLDMVIYETGNRHALKIVDIIENQAMVELAHLPEYSDYNITFISIKSRDMVILKTHEKGVGFTLSCGSASVASYCYLRNVKKINKRCLIITPGGTFFIDEENDDILLYGEVNKICEGEYNDGIGKKLKR